MATNRLSSICKTAANGLQAGKSEAYEEGKEAPVSNVRCLFSRADKWAIWAMLMPVEFASTINALHNTALQEVKKNACTEMPF